jgi:hypothetical protein
MTKRPSLPTAAPDEEQRRDSMLQDEFSFSCPFAVPLANVHGDAQLSDSASAALAPRSSLMRAFLPSRPRR